MAPARGATKDQDTATDEAVEQDTQDTAAEGSDGTEGADNGATAEANGRKGKMPTYGMEKIGDSLPEDTATGRAQLYHDLLVPLTEDPGEWYQVAEFKTPNGARQAAKELADGKRNVPEGDWEFDTRKVPNPTNPTKRWSRLYARFMG